jgi:hypothetical protein
VVGVRGVGGCDRGRAGDEIGENADFDAALENGEFEVERRDFVCEALCLLATLHFQRWVVKYVAEPLESPTGCAVHPEPRSADMRSCRC